MSDDKSNELTEEQQKMVQEAHEAVAKMRADGAFTHDPRVEAKQSGPVGEVMTGVEIKDPNDNYYRTFPERLNDDK